MSIYTCLKEAHEASNSVLPLFSWVEEHYLSSHMFKFRMLIDKFPINYQVFTGSMRKDTFKLFLILISLVNWFFIFKHYNYARWLSVHIHDLLSLPITFLLLYQELLKGNFGIQFIKTKLMSKEARAKSGIPKRVEPITT